DTNLTVQVNLTGTGAVASNTIQLYNGSGTGTQLGTSYTITAADITTGSASVQTGTLTDGTTYAITARLTDAAGNHSVVSSNIFNVTVDPPAPTAATICSVSDDLPPLTASPTRRSSDLDTNLTVQVNLTGTGAVAGNTIQLYNGTTTGTQLG